MKQIVVGLLGAGTVGSQVARILEERKAQLARLGLAITIKKALVRDPSRPRPGLELSQLTSSAGEILEDPEIQVVVELLGGREPARTYMLQALEAGKQVVTANKDVMSRNGAELWELAERKSLDLYFEASVGGGIPIIRPLKELLAANRFSRVMGIVNGTTNFILSRMSEVGLPFLEALAQAQERGYAEADPAADVEGWDAAAKIAILSSLAFNSRVTVDQVYAEGISGITSSDIAYAAELGYCIKLVAMGKEVAGELEVRVHPTMLPRTHPLAAVGDVNNAIFLEGDCVGELMFYGRGAGGAATASSVISDLMETSRNLIYGSTGKIPCTCFMQKRVKSIEEAESSYYLLLDALDRPGVLARIAGAFGEAGVSIDKVIQKRTRDNVAELMFITHHTREGAMRKSLQDIGRLEVVRKVANLIRVEDPAIG